MVTRLFLALEAVIRQRGRRWDYDLSLMVLARITMPAHWHLLLLLLLLL